MSRPRILTAFVQTLGALASVAALALASVYGASEWMLRRTYDAPHHRHAGDAGREVAGDRPSFELA